MPSYLQVSEWIRDWAKNQTQEAIAKSFKICGFGPLETFSVDDLHKPLRDCFSSNFSAPQWEDENMQNVGNDEEADRPDEEVEYKFFSEKFSFLKALYSVIKEAEDYEYWLNLNKMEIRNAIISDGMLSSLFNEDEKKQFDGGKPTSTNVEIVAASRVFKVTVNLIEIDKDCNILDRTEYACEEAEKTIKVFKFEELFGVQLADVEIEL